MARDKLCILCCQNFYPEVAAGIAAEGWSDVVAAAFPARCGRPALRWDELRSRLPEDVAEVLVLGCACLHGLGPAPAGFPPGRTISLPQCFCLVAGEPLVNEALAAGAYLLTPAWLADWRGQLESLGFNVEHAGKFLAEFARELVLFDTGVSPEAEGQLAEFAAAVRLPFRRVVVGLEYVRLRLGRLAAEWRLARQIQATWELTRVQAGELADHVAAMDMLMQLAATRQESEAIAVIEDLFRMLFAPASLHYARVENELLNPASPVPAASLALMRSLEAGHAWTPDGCGFLLRITRGEETLGVVAVEGLAFPQYRDRYLRLALAVVGVCGLAIENARHRKRLLDAEKMASLGMLVAGVAHEINTPLGIGVTAASTLQDRARCLAESFASRSMTQAELRQFLEDAAASTRLLRQNLARIGTLVDTFRQVAVGGQPAASIRFRLRECLDDVCRSFGERLPADRIAVHIECPPDLELTGTPSDWATVFVNLIGNSLKHGFQSRVRGSIVIQAAQVDRRLIVDYRDDGAGMSADALVKIYEPFFTTDLQHGLGLGMHLVYNLITHRFGGSIVCGSQPGEGWCCRIEAPLPEESASRVAKTRLTACLPRLPPRADRERTPCRGRCCWWTTSRTSTRCCGWPCRVCRWRGALCTCWMRVRTTRRGRGWPSIRRSRSSCWTWSWKRSVPAWTW